MLKKHIFIYKNKNNNSTETSINKFYKNMNIEENSGIDTFYIWKFFNRGNPNYNANILQNIWINGY